MQLLYLLMPKIITIIIIYEHTSLEFCSFSRKMTMYELIHNEVTLLRNTIIIAIRQQ